MTYTKLYWVHIKYNIRLAEIWQPCGCHILNENIGHFKSFMFTISPNYLFYMEQGFKKWTFVGQCAAFWSIFARLAADHPCISHDHDHQWADLFMAWLLYEKWNCKLKSKIIKVHRVQPITRNRQGVWPPYGTYTIEWSSLMTKCGKSVYLYTVVCLFVFAKKKKKSWGR